MATRYWFRPKTYGYGATPTTWEGWALTLGSVAMVVAATWYFLGVSAVPDTKQWLAWASTVVVTVALLAIVSHRKTDGAWRWRWGSSSDLR